jgi:hypothetical protein
MKTGCTMKRGPFCLLVSATLAQAADPVAKPIESPLAGATGAVPSPLIDYPTYLQVAAEAGLLREKRQVSEEQFAAMVKTTKLPFIGKEIPRVD